MDTSEILKDYQDKVKEIDNDFKNAKIRMYQNRVSELQKDLSAGKWPAMASYFSGKIEVYEQVIKELQTELKGS